ncbi:sensor histidine kinase [Paenibacillus whitsoniae]|nr:sensor histidine kinase [Paenibacillus whitsoniae]
MRHHPILQRFANQRLLTKMLVLHLFVLLPLVISSFFAYSSYSASIKKSVGKSQGDVVHELTTNIDTYMNELNLLTTMPYQTPEIMRFLTEARAKGAPLTLDESNTISSFINHVLVNGRVNVASLYLYGVKGASYVLLPESIATTSRKLEEEPWYERISASNNLTYLGPHEVHSSNGVTSRVITAARKIKSIQSGKLIGYFVLDVPVSAIESRSNHLASSNFGSIAIVDEQGALVYKDPGMDITDSGITGYRGSGSLEVHVKGKDELLTYYTSNLTGWTTIGTVPMSLLLKDTVQVRNNIVLLGVICLGLAVVISIWLAFFITRPISQLRNLMKKVEQGDLGVSIPILSRDEVGQLSQTFNVMVSRLSDLGYKLYETEIREKNAQLAALQNQMNPHFLYNTLGSVSMYAEIQGNREIVEITNNLSHLLRYSINSDQSEVFLGQELRHVEGYMAIQLIRFEHKLHYEMNVDPAIYANLVIRLGLQPIVENCIIHGFGKTRGKGTIRITGVQEGDSIQVVIEDDGKGMTAAELQTLRTRMQYGRLSDDGPSGHGVVNVHRRLMLRYGASYGLEVESEPMKGTRVTLKFPVNDGVQAGAAKEEM